MAYFIRTRGLLPGLSILRKGIIQQNNVTSRILTISESAECTRRSVSSQPAFRTQENGETGQELQNPVRKTLNATMRTYNNQLLNLGRIEKKHVEDMLTVVEKEGSLYEPQATFLLRCAGKVMVREPPAAREQFLDKIWEVLQRLSVPPSVQLYHATLRVHIENGRAVNSQEFLEKMEASGVQPTKVTYTLLVMCHCEHGELDDALLLVEKMKHLEMEVGEGVFGALVKGCMIAGKEDQIPALTDLMRSKDICVTAAYQAMLEVYAERGDLPSIQKYVQTLQTETGLTPNTLIGIIYKLAINGHESIINQVMKLNDGVGLDANQLCNMIFQLLATGHVKAAGTLMPSFISGSDGGSQRTQRIVSFYNTLDLVGRPLEEHIAFVNVLPQDVPVIAGRILSSLLKAGDKSALATFIRDHLLKKNQTELDHRDAKRFLEGVNTTNITQLKECMKFIAELDIMDSAKLSILYPTVVQCLINIGETLENISMELHSYGLSAMAVKAMHLLAWIEQGELGIAVKDVDSKSHLFTPILLCRAVQSGLSKKTDTTDIALFLGKLPFLFPHRSVRSSNSAVIDTVKLFINCVEPDQIIPFVINPLVKAGLNLSWLSIKALVQDLPQIEMEVRNRLYDLASDSRETYSSEPQPKVTDSATSPLAHAVLLTRYASSGNVEKAEAVKHLLATKFPNFTLNKFSLNGLVYLAARHKKDLKEALSYRQHIFAADPDSACKNFEPTFDIMALQIESNLADDAVTLFEDHMNIFKSSNNDSLHDHIENVHVQRKIESIIEILKGKNEVYEGDLRVAALLESYSLLPDASVANTHIQLALENEDSEKALQIFLWSQDKVNVCDPAPLMRYYIKQENTERLQTLVDVLTASPLHPVKVSNILFFELISLNKVKQARKVSLLPSFKLDVGLKKEKLQSHRTDVAWMTSLAGATEGLAVFHRGDVLMNLLRAMLLSGDQTAPAAILEKCEMEDVTPSGYMLKYITGALKLWDLDVPDYLADYVDPAQGAFVDEYLLSCIVRDDRAEAVKIAQKYPDMFIQREEVSQFSESQLRFLLQLTTEHNLQRQWLNRIYSRLVHLLCVAEDVHGALEEYHAARQAGVKHESVGGHTLRLLTALLIRHDVPAPYGFPAHAEMSSSTGEAEDSSPVLSSVLA